MSAVGGLLCGASALLLTWIVYETLKNMLAKEAETRLERLPYAILRLARRRLPLEHRETIHDEEWLPELVAIVRSTEGLPVTRLIRGIDFAVGLLLSAPKVSHVFGRLRWKPSAPPEITPQDVDAPEQPFRTYAAGEIRPSRPPRAAEWARTEIPRSERPRTEVPRSMRIRPVRDQQIVDPSMSPEQGAAS